jgi:hypothetical protein
MNRQIIKALNLYRQKTGTNNFFWVLSIAQALLPETLLILLALND